MWVVRVALQRPYSFVVLALLIAIFGILAALNAVLRALKEVQDQLSTLRWLAEEYSQTTTAATAARQAADLSLTLYRDGASSTW